MLGITLMNFTLINVSPGDPVIVRLGLLHCANPDCYNNAYNREAIEMGLMSSDLYTIPWFTRYVDYISDLLRFDFGRSWYNTQAGIGIPIANIIADHASYTVILNVISFVLSLLQPQNTSTAPITIVSNNMPVYFFILIIQSFVYPT